MAEKKIQGQEKLKNYLDAFIESDFFQKKIKKLRIKYHIPPMGFDSNAITTNNYPDSYLFHLPKELVLKKQGSSLLRSINIDVRDIAKHFPVGGEYLKTFFKLYLFYNKKFYFSNYSFLRKSNLCNLVDLREEFEEYDGAENFYIDLINHRIKEYPIAIMIQPNASQRDIVNYIERNWSDFFIRIMKYRNKNQLGKIKNKRRKERDLFIYEHRHLPRKEIARLVNTKFLNQAIDYGNVGKIISLERKRRKEL